MALPAALSRLRSIAQRMPRPGCEWEEAPRFDPPETEQVVAQFENETGFCLPPDLREFLAATGAVVAMSIHNGYWVGGLSLLSRSIKAGELPTLIDGIPSIPVATDGGGNAFLLARDQGVWKWNHETDAFTHIARSFSEFLSLVADDWEAYVTNKAKWKYLT